MKYINYIYLLVFAIFTTACVTGNDDSEVLREHEEALEKTARVLELQVDGQEMSRDSLSNWRYVFANPGEELTITAVYSAGKDASEGSLVVSEYVFHTATPFGLIEGDEEGYSVLESMDFGSGEEDFTFTVQVPTTDAEGNEFLSGDHINYAFWSWNDQEGYGYNDFTVEIN